MESKEEAVGNLSKIERNLPVLKDKSIA